MLSMKMWTARRLSLVLLVVFSALPCQSAYTQELLKKIPVTIKADKLDYDRTNDVYTALGHVKIEQVDRLLEADTVVLNNKTGDALAEGKVYLRDKGDILRAEKLEFNVNTGAGIIYNGEIFMSKTNVHLKGAKIERFSETVYRIEQGTFTTCDEGEWYLKAREINVDMDKYATGKGVSFNMTGLPVLYTPYLLFPVRRQSGLLIPELGNSSSEGFLLKNSIFWALSDYQDMTFTSDYRSRLGLGTGVEYRYENSRDSSGKAYYNYFDMFQRYRVPATPAARWELAFQHAEEFAEDLSARVDINQVGEEFYYRDLEKKLELRSRPYLDSNAFYVERWDTAALYLMGQYSTDLTQPNLQTIQKLPELRYMIFNERIAGPLHLNFDGSAVNFSRQQGDVMRRADFNPGLAAAFGAGGFGFTPRAGVHATFYDRGAGSTEPVERKYYYAGADLNVRFSKVFGTDDEAGLGRIRHSVEPTISYMYVPHLKQEDIPQFDSIDSVAAQNLITVSLTNRLTAHYKDAAGFRTYDMMVFKLSESYDVDAARTNDAAVSQPRSEIKGELYVKTPKLLTFTASGAYNTYTRRRTSSSESLTVTGDVVQFDITHQDLQSPKTEFLIGGVGLKLSKVELNTRLWRDMENRTTTQKELKAHYASQCWGLGVSYISRPGETQYLVTFDLKGIGAMKL
jgi:LPS-assembly protein